MQEGFAELQERVASERESTSAILAAALLSPNLEDFLPPPRAIPVGRAPTPADSTPACSWKGLGHEHLRAPRKPGPNSTCPVVCNTASLELPGAVSCFLLEVGTMRRIWPGFGPPAGSSRTHRPVWNTPGSASCAPRDETDTSESCQADPRAIWGRIAPAHTRARPFIQIVSLTGLFSRKPGELEIVDSRTQD